MQRRVLTIVRQLTGEKNPIGPRALGPNRLGVELSQTRIGWVTAGPAKEPYAAVRSNSDPDSGPDPGV
jgi:hypothetical protein